MIVIFAASPSKADALPMVPGIVDAEKGVSICQHSRVEAPLEAPMIVMLSLSAASAEVKRATLDSNCDVCMLS